jgi:hypothetical protein
MKQGRATRDEQSEHKVEPKPRAVNPGGVNQLGNHLGAPGGLQQFYDGKGYKTSQVPTLGKGNQGPGAHRTVHKTGSQGTK